jgi:hypothetical protein
MIEPASLYNLILNLDYSQGEIHRGSGLESCSGIIFLLLSPLLGALYGERRGQALRGAVYTTLLCFFFSPLIGIILVYILMNGLTDLKTKVCPNCGTVKKNRGLLNSPCCLSEIQKDNEFSVMPIHMAVAGQQIGDIKKLLSPDCNLNAKTAAGMTPLLLAKNRKRFDIHKLLKEHGAEG